MKLSFKQYKTFDLAFTAFLLCVFEILVQYAGNKWFKTDFTLSITTTIVALVMMRWSGYALIHAVAGGLVDGIFSCLTVGKAISPMLCVVGACGNLFCVFALLLIKFVGKQKIHDNFLWSSALPIAIYLLSNLGKAVVSLFYGAPFASIFNFLFNDVISVFFAVIAVCIFRLRDGMFEDQKAYLFRIEREEKQKAEEAEKEANSKNKVIINVNKNDNTKDVY